MLLPVVNPSTVDKNRPTSPKALKFPGHENKFLSLLNPYPRGFLSRYSGEAQSYGNDFKGKFMGYGKRQNLAPLKFKNFNEPHPRRIRTTAISAVSYTCSARASR
jgi:hypothetical protein